ncbi:alkaline phosphatase family protein [Labilibaculum antarcticum]|uniref:Alkaline phosphatase family protein n=1 Tax=Labilibaculum antarcticum TaxID=1717717 RepID=A0A1Y1CE98_9BACT|nr:alkaline phosphatase family protein [Labilibaculum antarcticum]BAX78640.1 hypothetical protein ALGA_0245 [Labilibaculum antarcticum]
MKVVFFLLDAFKEEYLSEDITPFLFEKAKEGKHIKKIIPSAGFCERTEIFFGLRPKESGFFTAIGFDYEKGLYKNLWTLNFFGWIENVISYLAIVLLKRKKNIIDKYCHSILLKIYLKFFGTSKKLKPYKIPLSFLSYFNLTEDEFDLYKRDEINSKKSLFKVVEEFKGRTYIDAFTSLGGISNGDDENRIKLAIEASKNVENVFIPIYISISDSAGHYHGPNSERLKSELLKLDSLLQSSVEKFSEIDSSTKFLFLGDHGMTEVVKDIDVKMKISEIAIKHRLKTGTDFIYFLDSTLLRMWFFNDKSRNIFSEEIKNDSSFNENGIVINADVSSKYYLPVGDRKYGDLTWWANEGVLIFPDFFHNDKALKGMHGYRPDTQSTYGTCIVWDEHKVNDEVEKLELFQVYDLINNLLKD